MDTATVHFARVRPEAVIPSKRAEDAGYDIYACLETPYLCIGPLRTASVPTGIASALPAGYYFQIQERGSSGTRGIAARCGVIDSGYRGEWFLPVTNLNDVPLYIARADAVLPAGAESAIVYPAGKALMQAILLRLPEAEITEIPYDELCRIPSERGTGAKGSSLK